jgi:hypothetical protein
MVVVGRFFDGGELRFVAVVEGDRKMRKQAGGKWGHKWWKVFLFPARQ